MIYKKATHDGLSFALFLLSLGTFKVPYLSVVYSFMNPLDQSLMSALRPHEVNPMIRLGGLNDGGYVVPQESLINLTHLVSFGYGNDAKFENDFLNLNTINVVDLFESSINIFSLLRNLTKSCFFFWQHRAYPIYHFKNLVKYLALKYNKRIRYHNLRVTSTKLSRKDIPISTIISEISNYSSTALKIDIESGEYEILPLINFYASGFLLLIIEFHEIQSRKSEFLALLENLKEYYGIVNTHFNNFGSVLDGIPDVVEITFLRRNQIPNNSGYRDFIPSLLDSPCNPRRAEIIHSYL